jgi:hypothetical protein
MIQTKEPVANWLFITRNDDRRIAQNRAGPKADFEVLEISRKPVPAPEPITKIKKRRQRRQKSVTQPVPIVAEVKSVMHRIFESQREQLIQLQEDIQKVIFLGW